MPWRNARKAYNERISINEVKKMTAGRPTKYGPKMVQKALHYIDNHQEYDDLIPSVAGLAVVLNVGRNTIYDWAKDPGKKFSNILEQLSVRQERVLLAGGLSGDMNSTIVKLVLAKQGYKEATATELSGPNQGPIQVTNEWSVQPVKPANQNG